MSSINITSVLDGSAGSAQGKVGTTITTFTISLAAGFIFFVVQFTTFLIIRNYLWAKRIYQPRSFLVPVRQRIKPPQSNPFQWLVTLFTIREDPEVLKKAGMDAYFFIRFLSMCFKIFTPMTLLIIPILIPLNVSNGKGQTTVANVKYNITGLDTMAWSNVSPEKTSRYWAHLVLAIAVVAWVCFTFHEELIHYISKREEYLGSLGHRLKASSTTVLIQDIPPSLCNEKALQELYGDFPGGVRRIWINRNLTTLVEKDDLRKHYEDLLENAETDLLRKAAKKQRKGNLFPQNTSQDVPLLKPSGPDTAPPTPALCQSDLEYDIATKAEWTKYVAPKQRATIRIPKEGRHSAAKIPLIGLFFTIKVDTIYFCRRELGRLNKAVEIGSKDSESYPKNLSAFIQFNSQKAAHLACQSIADIEPKHMRNRLVEISPGDILWPNLNLSWRDRYIRFIIFLVFYLLLLLAFAVISFFTGILSRVSTLSGSTPWLRWVSGLPTWLLSFVQGTLPPVIQVILLSGPLPIILRHLTNKTQGSTTGQAGERSLQLWYFIFLLVELLIIPTVSAGLTSIVSELIRSPTTVPNILATNLPTASNYYFSFLILQALSLSATSLLQTIRLFNFYVLGHVNTPDAVFQKLSWTNMTRIGSNIPWYTTFAVIGLVYSIIAPLILLFMLITFGLFWVVIKNNLIYCVRTGIVDGGGLFFPSAINQLFTGLYFMEVCLIGLFFLVRDSQDQVACDIQGIIMSIVLILTVLYQVWLMNHLSPLFKFAPVRLEMENKTLLEDREDNDNTKDSQKDETRDAGAENSTIQPSQSVTQDKDGVGSGQLRPHIRQRQASNRSQDLKSQQQEDVITAERILARINQPLNETRLAELEKTLARSETGRETGQGDGSATEGYRAKALLPKRKDIEQQMLDDPISQIIMQHIDELENLDPEERDMLISVAFTHPVLRKASPSVWIPMDDLGVSDDEVRRTRELSKDVVIDNRGAYFNSKLKVRVNKPPPDMSEFALIIDEL